ncbi:Gfo/Idh/MocA family protein [Tropicibacter oceani]|uniref:Gfo/Idh/MocA family oxidoreductase n=1 Tax=Tropicibacter oceani TaxID=3058420 RepID=A0ABY8QHC0_9RHOB|nr:Gfo/Idh/MocA family oxidoreductase [Tropicibacter oceani]WGW03557.1 Gfo/Idh/MocA family oxidoreductase [Tropicibacter oceani]
MKIAIVGVGKIALDQHVPAIKASPDWELAATCSRHGSVEGVEAFTDFAQLLEARPDIRVVSLCMPPVPRFDYARAAILAGRHVMLEKPPGASLAECHALESMARAQGVSLFATWHSRCADQVPAAKAWLADKRVTRAHITWRESVRKWHPGQDWVFEPGGMGVFDPGINALSILTEILPAPVHLTGALLEFPENRQTPIAARLAFSGHTSAEFDWREETRDIWQIEVATDAGTLTLQDGGARMVLNAVQSSATDATPSGEYPRLYAQMAALVQAGAIDMDLAPLVHVADAFMLGQRKTVAPFVF